MKRTLGHGPRLKVGASEWAPVNPPAVAAFAPQGFFFFFFCDLFL
jgi:hypothetical protein